GAYGDRVRAARRTLHRPVGGGFRHLDRGRLPRYRLLARSPQGCAASVEFSAPRLSSIPLRPPGSRRTIRMGPGFPPLPGLQGDVRPRACRLTSSLPGPQAGESLFFETMVSRPRLFPSMCGIVGAIASRDVVPILTEGLKRLEYRGYDSAGIAVLDGGIRRVRRVGRVSEMENAARSENLKGIVGIAHTRWATHGGVTEPNAHPHVSGGEIAVV